jgi:hypothetical protein
VLRSAADTLALITSPIIRYALAVEVERILSLDDVHRDAAPILADMLSQLAPSGIGDPPPTISAVPNPSRNPSANPSDVPSGGSPGERGVVTVRTTDFPSPQEAPAVPPPAAAATPPTPGRQLAVVADEPRTAQQIIGWWIEHCEHRPPGRVVGQMSREIKTLIEEGIDPAFVRRGIAEWSTKDLSPSLLPSIVNSIMNRRSPPNGQRQISPGEANVQDWMTMTMPPLEAFR